MNLEEIEAKADELLADVLSEDHASRAEHAARKLRCLELTARIKSTVAFRKEREAERSGQQAAFQLGVPFVPQVVHCTECTPEPTKPVADRLHELVSYLIRNSETNHHAAGATQLGAASEERYQAISKAYDDAATKLQEILNEGGI